MKSWFLNYKQVVDLTLPHILTGSAYEKNPFTKGYSKESLYFDNDSNILFYVGVKCVLDSGAIHKAIGSRAYYYT